jgi:hypothetical protein
LSTRARRPLIPPGLRCRGDPSSAYAELGKIVLGHEPLGAVMRRIAELAAQTIPGADEVSVTLIERGRLRTVHGRRPDRADHHG